MSCPDQSLAAQTVVHLASHMRQLRGEAERLQEALQARERGFFTPIEDDQVTHLWVSYHKSRNALLELIEGTRQAVGRAKEEHTAEFTIAYGAALILIDAARSLRDLFAENSLVRRKLNESYASFGIDKGSFDAIQMSLTDPVNAVRLKSARDFFDSHEATIRQSAANHSELGEVLGVIDELGDRVRVSSARYLKARAVDRGHDVKDFFLGGMAQAVYFIQEFGSRIVGSVYTVPSHVPQLPETIRAKILDLIQPGDVFITRKENALTNYFLPGYWPHAAFYVGGQQVIESLKDGVRKRSMESPWGNDAVVIIRPKVSQQAIENAIERAHGHVGKPYDFDFDFTRADRMVCTEVVYRSFEGLEGMRFQLSRRAGRETLSAEDLLELAMQRQQFDQVAVYCPKHSDQLLVETEMSAVLEQTVVRNQSS